MLLGNCGDAMVCILIQYPVSWNCLFGLLSSWNPLDCTQQSLIRSKWFLSPTSPSYIYKMLDGHSALFALTICSYTVLERFSSYSKTCCNLESPALHLNLLIFALQTTLTTAVCIVEYHSWPELTSKEKSNLGGLYIPYLVFGESIDIFHYDDFVLDSDLSLCL